MDVSYKKLLHLLIGKAYTSSRLQQEAGISTNIISIIKKNDNISLDTVERIYKVLNCSVDDILVFNASYGDK